MNNFKLITLTTFKTLTAIVALILVGGQQSVQAQATISGSVTVYQPPTTNGGVGGTATPAVLYSIGGQLSTPSGLSFSGPATIVPGGPNPLSPILINNLPDLPVGVSLPGNLFLGYTGINVDPPSTANAQVADRLNNLTVANDLAEIVSIIRASNNIDDSYTPASASGTVTYSNGTFLQTISGEITLQSGYFGIHDSTDPLILSFYGLYIEPSFGRLADNDPNSGNYPISQGIISSLVISPGNPTRDNPPSTLNAAAASKLTEAFGDLQAEVSILRAGQNLLNDSKSNQSSASGSTTFTVIDSANPDYGFTQSISGQIVLPNGLFYNGADVQTSAKLSNPSDPLDPERGFCKSATSGGATGCIFVAAISNNVFPTLGNPQIPQLQKLIIDPGPVNQATPVPGLNFNFSTAAATRLGEIANNNPLSDLVSFIRAGTGINGPPNNPSQARASGSISISMLNGTTQSVSGEVTLPPGLYFERDVADGDCRNGAGGCLAVKADVQLNTDNSGIPGGLPDQSSLAYINQLDIDPGLILPGDPTIQPVVGLSPHDFNARAALALYNAVDSQTAATGSLSDVVSIIRAGVGANGISSSVQPTASASGAGTLVLPNGAMQTVTGQVTLPQGLYYTASGNLTCVSAGGCLTIKPTFTPNSLYDGNVATLNTGTIASLNVDPGTLGTTKTWTFEAAAAYALTQQTTLSDQVSVIRAVAGSAGLE